MLGEEGNDVAGSSGLRWVVDPLDGTVNFLFGIPQWSVSIAWRTVRASSRGSSSTPCATSCGRRRATAPPMLNGDASAACRASGSRARRSWPRASATTPASGDVQAEILGRLLPLVRDVRRLGSAALDLAWTAAGRYDAYFERGVNHWDRAAGALICARAGLLITPLPAAPPSGPGRARRLRGAHRRTPAAARLSAHKDAGGASWPMLAPHAAVAELVYAPDSSPGERKLVWVRVPPAALRHAARRRSRRGRSPRGRGDARFAPARARGATPS